jgi:circadian clock protein KaiC
MTGIARAASGIPGFDTVCHGGFPAGRATVVAGMPGSGKSLLALQFLVNGAAEHGEAGIYVTFEERRRDVLDNVRQFDWDLDAHTKAGTITIIDASDRDGELHVGGYDLDGLIARIEHAARQNHASRLVIDSLSAVIERFAGRGEARNWMLLLVSAIRALGLTSLLLVERRDEGEHLRSMSVESVVADAVVLLRNNLGGSVRQRTIEVAKLRGGSHERGAFPSSIRSGTGFQVVPLAASALDRPAAVERSSLGHPVLDEMTGGGVYRDTITLLRGPSGAGKTLVAAGFLAAAAQAGGRGLMFSFEESPQEVMRNAGSVGIDLGAAIEDGRLRIVSRYPERLPLEDLLMRLQDDIERDRPSRIVLDSLSALSRSARPAALRDFIVGLTTYLKETQTAGLLTEQPMLDNEINGDDSFASSLADAVLLLRYEGDGGAMRRSLTVLKVRGSAHASDMRPYVITSEGLRFDSGGPG